MLLIEHLPPNIVMTVNYCGRQLARRLWWAAPTYHKKEGAIPCPGTGKFCLLYDGRPGWRFRAQVWTWNVGGLSGEGEKFVKDREKG